ncbi:MAG: hypothetical protein AAF517_01500 [Planctomycetota bacterium]
MRTPSRLLLTLLILWQLGAAGRLRAQSELVLTDGHGISGFELYDDGLFWYHNRACGGEFFFPGTVRLRGAVNSITRTLADDCDTNPADVQGVVRDSVYAYYFVDGELHRKSVSGSLSTPSHPLMNDASAPSNLGTGKSSPLAIRDGWLYWAKNTGRAHTIYRTPTASPDDYEALLSIFSPDLRKLEVFPVQSSRGIGDQLALAWLTWDNDLVWWRFGSRGPIVLATGITDFANHRVATSAVTKSDWIYAAKSVRSIGPFSQPGSLLRINVGNGQQTVIYRCGGFDQILSVTTDSDTPFRLTNPQPRNVYITEAEGSCDGLLCLVGKPKVLRHGLPGADDGGWQVIVANDAGYNLRSDDKWLYYSRNPNDAPDEIRRIPTDAPPAELDLEALDVVAVQTVQDREHAIPLVAGRGAYVRGYARLRKNNSGLSSYSVSAELRVFIDGEEMNGSPFQSYKSVAVDSSDDLYAMRSDADRSFLFKLPPLPTGKLTASFTVDPNQALTELGGGVFANNTVNLTPGVDVLDVGDTCLAMVPMRTPWGTYNVNSPGFAAQLKRTESLLPSQRIRWFRREIDLLSQLEVFAPGVDDPEDQALNILTFARMLSSDPAGCPDLHWVGMIHPMVPNFNGLGWVGGPQALISRMASTELSIVNTPHGGRTLAHELGHNYGREHIDCGNPDGVDQSYPHNPCHIGVANENGAFGFDVISRTAIAPDEAGDLMSYASKRWTSDYTYEAIMRQIMVRNVLGGVAGNGEALADEYVLVRGHVNHETLRGSIGSAYVLPASEIDPERLMESIAAADDAARVRNPVLIKIMGPDGETLSETPLLTYGHMHGEGEGHDDDHRLLFTQYVPWDPRAGSLQVLVGIDPYAEADVSENAPTVEIKTLNVDLANQFVEVSWTAKDDDRDPLRFAVHFSPDDGATWQALTVDYSHYSFASSLKNLPESDEARIRVIASDGILSSLAVSEKFSTPPQKAEVWIDGPGQLNIDGPGQIPFGETVLLHGLAINVGQELGVEVYSWEIEGAMSFSKQGSSVELNDLVPGGYSVKLTVFNRGGTIGTAELNFEVLPVIVETSSAPTLDGSPGDRAWADAVDIRVPSPLGDWFYAKLLHADDALWISFSELHYSSRRGAEPAIVGIQIDPDNEGDSPDAGDVGFFVSSEGLISQTFAARGQMIGNNSPHVGVEARVLRGPGAWSAEMRIPVELIGGWEHLARFMLHHSTADRGAPTNWPQDALESAPLTWSPAVFGTAPLTPQENLPPVAVVPADPIINVASATIVQLDGSASYDPEGAPLSYNWVQIGGPTVSIFGASNAVASFMTPPLSGVEQLFFELRVSDGQLISPQAEITITLVPTQTEPDDAPQEEGFLRADADGDGARNVTDGVFTLNFLFLGGPPPRCRSAADADDDGRLGISDSVYTFGFLFLGGPQPPAPFETCGEDPTRDELGCQVYDSCP